MCVRVVYGSAMPRAKTSIILLRRPSRFNRSQLIEPSRSNLRRSWHRQPVRRSRWSTRPEPSADRIISSCLAHCRAHVSCLLTLFRVMTSLLGHIARHANRSVVLWSLRQTDRSSDRCSSSNCEYTSTTRSVDVTNHTGNWATLPATKSTRNYYQPSGSRHQKQH